MRAAPTISGRFRWRVLSGGAALLAVIGVTVGELLGGNTGLGFLITYGEGQSDTAMVFDAIVLLTAIGIALYFLVGLVERRVLHYV